MLGRRCDAPCPIQEHVENSNGDLCISRVLIANNGIAAVKGIRSCRRWCYEVFHDERAIHFTVMATPEDLHANAEYIRLADFVFEVPGGPNIYNYANIKRIVDTAVAVRAHAVWAGWGHASENPDLVDALQFHGIAFIGPTSAAMRALGDKIASTILAQSAGVPTVAWSGDGVKLETTKAGSKGQVTIDPDLCHRATVHSWEGTLQAAQRIGFPVMIKASAGGGGKGIRKVTTPENVRVAFEQVCQEVPGSPIFVMKVLRNVRHIEIQILADHYGNVISLFGRDCSIQRRHQKVIEEAPPSMVPPEVLERMESSAIRLAALVGYTSCGTVEYLYQPDTQEFYFLELNPRLQVEHPCTEMVTGINLPAIQLQIACGIPLHRIRDIRLLYGLAPNETSTIDFHFRKAVSLEVQRRPKPKGHVLAVRITAENPDCGFQPNMGALTGLVFRSSASVWGYFSVDASGRIHEFADSQFGHMFAYGENREQARKHMVIALKELSIRGDFRTSVEYLIEILEMPQFVSGKIDTEWLDNLIANHVKCPRPPTQISILFAAAVKAAAVFRQEENEFIGALRRGVVRHSGDVTTRARFSLEYEGYSYNLSVYLLAAKKFAVELNGGITTLHLRTLGSGEILVTYAGNTYSVYATIRDDSIQLTVNGNTCVIDQHKDPFAIRSPTSGKLLRYMCKDGDHVEAGTCLAELEVMKMCMPLLAKSSGTWHQVVPAGSIVSTGDTIGRFEVTDCNGGENAVYAGKFSFLDGLPDFSEIPASLQCILDGYSAKKLDDLLGHPNWCRNSQIDDLATATACRQLLDHFVNSQCYTGCSTSDLLELRDELDDSQLIRLARCKNSCTERFRVVNHVLGIISRQRMSSLASHLRDLVSLRNIGSISTRAIEILHDLCASSSPPGNTPLGFSAADIPELERLSNFDVRSAIREDSAFFISAISHTDPSDRRLFVRAAISECFRPLLKLKTFLDWFGGVLGHVKLLRSRFSGTKNNHIFLDFGKRPDENELQHMLASGVQEYSGNLRDDAIVAMEIKFQVMEQRQRWHVSFGPSGIFRLQKYSEVDDDGRISLKPAGRTNIAGDLNNMDALFRYPSASRLEARRSKAHLMGTSYVYDFPALFEEALETIWKKSGPSIPIPPCSFCECEELVLGSDGKIQKTKRLGGQNDCGMIGWILTLRTPEYPMGRPLILIANDITHQIGSFGPKEDEVFFKCSEYARQHGYPRIFINANSGARIGLAEELKDLFRIQWTAAKNVEYLYLLDEDLTELEMRCGDINRIVRLTKRVVGKEERYVITAIIGAQDGIGVENLSGSGMIAGETSRAYNEIFTASLVSGRSVGIGAYLVRLGQRVIQNVGQPIILTGSAALNKVIGKDVYHSNLQIGGVKIMHANGISHVIAQDDLDGIQKLLHWLSFVPCRKNRPLPIVGGVDSDPERRIEVMPVFSADLDPRILLSGGSSDGSETWKFGLFDKDSFFETMDGWARSVITGRARIGGIPVGVIIAETRATEVRLPADPAIPDSRERTETQAGQVWYPDSAFKTAQAIRDFNHGEQLPLIILANWRGFSGGLNDMYGAILKFGSMIVDALRDYRQPVLVYIPPHCQLRGGAWVVLDPSINPQMMELFADEHSRGGILEPEGVVEIKFRQEQLKRVIERTDQSYQELKGRVHPGNSLPVELGRLEQELLPKYRQAAVHFASLHDSPARMLAKNAVNGVITWENSRVFLYWRLRRRLAEEAARKRLQEVMNADVLTLRSLREQLQVMMGRSGLSVEALCDDRSIAEWLERYGDASHEFINVESRLQLQQQLRQIAKRNRVSLKELAEVLNATE